MKKESPGKGPLRSESLRNGSLSRISARKVYYGFLLLVLVLGFLAGGYRNLKKSDAMPVISSGGESVLLGEDGKVEEDEGFSYVYLPSGSYEMTICAKTEVSGAYYEILDKQTNVVYARKEYAAGEEYHTVRFTTDRPMKLMVVRNVSGEGTLTVYGYTLTPLDGVSCTDAKRTVQLAILFLMLLAVGVYRARYKDQKAFLLVTILAFAASLPFLSETIPEVHDIQFHLQRIAGIAEAVRDGQIPQRINTMFAGNGNITPIMYPQLLLIPCGILVYSGTTVYYAFRVGCILITFLTAYLGYIGGKELLGESEGLLFTVFWVLDPFRLNELFLRGAIGEALALAFVPMVLAGIWNLIYRNPRRGMFYLTIGMTGVLSSHVLTTVLCALFCCLLIGIRLLTHPVTFLKDLRRLGWIVLTGLTVLILNLWFLVPFLHFSGMDFYVSGQISLTEQTGVYLWQMFMDPKSFGGVVLTDSAAGEMSYTIGIATLLASIVLLWILVCQNTVRGFQRKVCALLLVMEAIAVFLSSNCFPWEFVFDHFKIIEKTLGNMQHTWRFLAYAALFGCIICTKAIVHAAPGWRRQVFCILMLLTAAAAVKTGTEYFENPIHAENKWSCIKWASLDYNLKEFAYDNDSYAEMKEVLEEGDGPHAGEDLVIDDYHADGTDFYASFHETASSGDSAEQDVVDGIGAREIYLPVSYYGLYRAYLSDGTELETAMADYYQYTSVVIPEGVTEGEISLAYAEPFSFKASFGISAAGGILFVVLCGAEFLRQRKQQQA